MVKIVGSFEVNDWAHWKNGFDNHAEAREKASIKTIYVGNEIENPNKVHIVMETPEAWIRCKSLCNNLKIKKQLKTQVINKKHLSW